MFTIMRGRNYRKVYSTHDVDGNTFALKSLRLQRKSGVKDAEIDADGDSLQPYSLQVQRR